MPIIEIRIISLIQYEVEDLGKTRKCYRGTICVPYGEASSNVDVSFFYNSTNNDSIKAIDEKSGWIYFFDDRVVIDSIEEGDLFQVEIKKIQKDI